MVSMRLPKEGQKNTRKDNQYFKFFNILKMTRGFILWLKLEAINALSQEVW
jgi:hypothetical protein